MRISTEKTATSTAKKSRLARNPGRGFIAELKRQGNHRLESVRPAEKAWTCRSSTTASSLRPSVAMMSYIQACGRILRYSPETADHVIITDHAGSHWRHTSPNADWDWQRWYCDNPSLPTRMKLNDIRDREELSPIVCHKCGAVRPGGLLLSVLRRHHEEEAAHGNPEGRHAACDVR